MLGLVEVLFGYGVAIFAMRERPSGREQLGTALLVIAILGLLWDRAAAGS
jgi:drug/metabolite transporter (DMT)-like permease